ncbi:MAG: hypothetical protein ABIB79_03640 [archaeon]
MGEKNLLDLEIIKICVSGKPCILRDQRLWTKTGETCLVDLNGSNISIDELKAQLDISIEIIETH